MEVQLELRQRYPTLGRLPTPGAAPHFLEQPLCGEGLGQYGARRVDAELSQRSSGIPRHENHWQFGSGGRKSLHQLDPIHPRHDDVRDHRVELMALTYQVDGFDAVPGFNYPISLALEHPEGKAADGSLIVDDENRRAGTRTQRDRGRGIVESFHVPLFM